MDRWQREKQNIWGNQSTWFCGNRQQDWRPANVYRSGSQKNQENGWEKNTDDRVSSVCLNNLKYITKAESERYSGAFAR